MEKWVTPNHFEVKDFEQFGNMAPDNEFNLIAPLTVYFHADMKYKSEARSALKKLKALKHPVVSDEESIPDLLKTTPAGLVNRYNALIMVIASEAAPDAKAYIDEYGAFGFRRGKDTCVLMGDNPGFFAFYLTAAGVRERLALDE